MENIEEFDKIRRDYIANTRIRKLVIGELVNDGRIARRDVSLIFSYRINVYDFNPAVLALVYMTIVKHDKEANRPAPEYFFTQRERDDALSLLKRQDAMEGYPIIFENAIQLSSKQEYLLCVSAQQIYDMSMNKIIRIRPDMARESEVLRSNTDTVMCVKYDPDKAEEISENFLHGTQHPNTLRLHLNVDIDGDSYTFNEKTNVLTIHKGVLANIDGNHRISGLINAITQNAHIASLYKFPVIMTIGTPEMARSIIVQEEKRTPIDAEHLESYKCQEGNRIVDILKQYPELESGFGFCTTANQFRAGGGFFVEHIVADAINQCFNLRKMMTRRQRDEIAQYLYDVFVTFYNYVDDIYPNYLREYAKHTDYAMSNEYTSYGLIYMAAESRKKPNEYAFFEEWLREINFHKQPNRRLLYGAKRIISFLELYKPV